MSAQMKQPRGMYVLGFAEVFERLSYYTLSFLLVLYASASIKNGGLGWTLKQSLTLAGYYTMAAYTLPLLGGYLADKFIGTFNAALMGATLIIIGHASMLFTSHEHTSIFYMALCFIATGTAFFKPSMPTLLGRLYKSTDVSREGGFKIYYMGINIGAMLAGLVGGLLSRHFGYQIALSCAGFGMVSGLIVLILGKKYLVIRTAHETSQINLEHKNSAPYSSIYKKAFGYLILSYLVLAVWGVTYNIAISGTLSLYIEHYTNKTIFNFHMPFEFLRSLENYDIPTPFFQSLESVGIIVFAPLLTFIFHKFALAKKPVHFFTQMNLSVFVIFIGMAYLTHLTSIVGPGFQDGVKPFEWWGIALFILAISLSEILISPVMMSAISLLSPLKYQTLFQAFYLAVLGLTALVASKIGSLSLTHPYECFFGLSSVTFATLLGFMLIRKRMVHVALAAASELHTAQEKKIA